jgi:hypothetical protein
VEGVDYASDKPSIAGLVSVGKAFACRYGGPGAPPKHLTAPEAIDLSKAGMWIVANAEGTESGLLGGARVGRDWALSAHDHFLACGMPASRPIYLSVDFDVDSSQWPSVRQALAAAGNVLGPDRVGVYGGLNAVSWAARDGVARWFWQTVGWSDGQWFNRAHIRQTRNNVSLVGGTVDLDTAMVSDYGQWQVGRMPAGSNGGDMTPEEHDLLVNTHYTLMHAYNSEGQPADPFHVWTHSVNEALSAIDQRLVRLDAEMVRPGQDGTDVGGMLTEVRDALRALQNAPLIDAVAVAQAIAAQPEIAATIATQVARQLSVISGAITLTGSLSGGIQPPPQ